MRVNAPQCIKVCKRKKTPRGAYGVATAFSENTKFGYFAFPVTIHTWYNKYIEHVTYSRSDGWCDDYCFEA